VIAARTVANRAASRENAGVNFSQISVPIPEPVLGFLAVLGVLAILVRLGRSLLRVGITLAEETAARGLAEASARRGDLTGLAERREQARALRRKRLQQLGASVLWAALLVVPALAGWSAPVYAASSLLWLLPRKPIRPRVAVVPPGV
jgi:hypothetical protein